MNNQDIEHIKKIIKNDYNFIKYSGEILNIFCTSLYLENNKNLYQTLGFINNLTKKNIIDKFEQIYLDMETANEIKPIIKEQIHLLKKELLDIEKSISININEKHKLDKEIDDTNKQIIDIQNKFLDSKVNYENKINDLQLKLDNKYTEFNLIDNSIHSLFTERYENEFIIEKCPYILTYDNDIYQYGNINHIHYIDTNKYAPFTLNYYNTYKINSSYKDSDDTQKYYSINYTPQQDPKVFKYCFPINIKLMNNEFICKSFIKVDNNYLFDNINNFDFSNNIRHDYDKHHWGYKDIINPDIKIKTYKFKEHLRYHGNKYKIYLVYITNFGRIFNSRNIDLNYKSMYHNDNYRCSQSEWCNKLYFDPIDNLGEYFKCYEALSTNVCVSLNANEQRQCTHNGNVSIKSFKSDINEYPLIEAPKLYYLMPKLFLDVIDAYETQNNDLMQTCNKKYINITRQDLNGKELNLIDHIEYIKILEEKNTIINNKNSDIEKLNECILLKNNEINDLKNEIIKLKSALLIFAINN